MTECKNCKYTDEYCASGDCTLGDNNLTEQWKKGKLPSGWYWVKGCRDKGIYAYTCEYLNHMYRPNNSDRIIEQVPSYEEWKAKLEQNAQLKELIRKAKGIITSYRLTGNQDTYSDNDMKECVAQIDEVLK